MDRKIYDSKQSIKSSIENITESLASSLQQIVTKGFELQQVAQNIVSAALNKDANANLFPRCEIVEGSDELYVIFELPGVGKDDFRLEISNNVLIIKGEKKGKFQDKAAIIHLGECVYGSFERNIVIPVKVDESKALAKLENGLLVVTFPKIPSSQCGKVIVPIIADQSK